MRSFGAWFHSAACLIPLALLLPAHAYAHNPLEAATSSDEHVLSPRHGNYDLSHAATALGRDDSIPQKLRVAFEAAPESTVTLWVFFKDKGEASEVAGAVAEMRTRFSPRALARRAKVRAEPLVDWRDVPVPRDNIELLRNSGFTVRAVSKWLNAVSVRCRAGDVNRLLNLVPVRAVRPVASFPKRELHFEEVPRPAEEHPVKSETRAAPSELLSSAAPGDTSFYGATWNQLQMIQAPALHAQGITGDGMFVGVLDTGFNLVHEALDSTKVVAQWDFINWDSVTSNEPGQDVPSQHNHGTMILGIIGGLKQGVYSGVAFDAEFALAKTEDVSSETPVEEDYWVMGIEWLDSLGVDLVTSSLGYIAWYTYEDMDGNTAVTTIAADMAVANGVSVFTAMGNGGATSYPYAIAPADGDSVMSIGGVDSLGSYWPSSSRGPTYDGRIKPEIVTQGSSVYCIHPSDSTAYGRAAGTSCATPLAAGGGTLILQKNTLWNPVMLREAIRVTGTNSSSPDTFVGWGILQAEDASNWVLLSALDESPGPVGPADSFVEIENAPNPFNPGTMISIRLTAPLGTGPVSASICDVAGRCVKDFGQLTVVGGSAAVVWDGKDGSGRGLPSGVYFFAVTAGEATETRKLLLLK
ncbi:MAG: S8 family serine peptidase [Candidatus Eiseniibacteriota bacterium]|nr:MAG: S8 family serine peptidase [Candidatus Eisenbacteria bacterium]